MSRERKSKILSEKERIQIQKREIQLITETLQTILPQSVKRELQFMKEPSYYSYVSFGTLLQIESQGGSLSKGGLMIPPNASCLITPDGISSWYGIFRNQQNKKAEIGIIVPNDDQTMTIQGIPVKGYGTIYMLPGNAKHFIINSDKSPLLIAYAGPNLIQKGFIGIQGEPAISRRQKALIVTDAFQERHSIIRSFMNRGRR